MEIFSYLSRDSRSIRSELVAMIPHLTDKWTDYHSSDPGIVLLELLVYVADKLSFYTDRMAMESMYITASERDNVVSGLKFVGYPMRGYYSAVTSVRLRSDHSHEIYVQKWDEFTTEEEDGVMYHFVAMEDVTVPPMLTGTVSVPLMEGTKITFNYDQRNIDSWGRIRIPNKTIAENSLELYINGEQWKKVDEVFFYDSLRPVFGVEYDRDGFPYIKLIKSWEEIVIDLSDIQVEILGLESSGSSVNFGRNTITRIVSDLQDELGEWECVKFINDIIHDDTVSGGADPETVEEAKRNAPRRLRTMWTAVTLTDYEDLCETYPGISKALAIDWSVGGAKVEDPYYMDLILVPKGGGNTSQTLKDIIYAYLMERRMAPLKFTIKDADYVMIDVEVSVLVRSGFKGRASLVLRVTEAVRGYFSSDRRTFGEVVRPALLRHYIESTVEDVLSAEIVLPSSNVVLELDQFPMVKGINVTVEEY